MPEWATKSQDETEDPTTCCRSKDSCPAPSPRHDLKLIRMWGFYFRFVAHLHPRTITSEFRYQTKRRTTWFIFLWEIQMKSKWYSLFNQKGIVHHLSIQQTWVFLHRLVVTAWTIHTLIRTDTSLQEKSSRKCITAAALIHQCAGLFYTRINLVQLNHPSCICAEEENSTYSTNTWDSFCSCSTLLYSNSCWQLVLNW